MLLRRRVFECAFRGGCITDSWSTSGAAWGWQGPLSLGDQGLGFSDENCSGVMQCMPGATWGWRGQVSLGICKVLWWMQRHRKLRLIVEADGSCPELTAAAREREQRGGDMAQRILNEQS